MSEVAFLPPSESMTVDQALDSVKNSNVDQVIILGYNEDGKLFVRSSKLCRKEALWIIECARNVVLNPDD